MHYVKSHQNIKSMKLKLSVTEADKIIFKKISSLKKNIKNIKVDKQGKFIDSLFKTFEFIQNITVDNSDYYQDNAQLEFSLNVYSNVDLLLFSSTIRGCNFNISAFEIDKENVRNHNYEDPFFEIKNVEELQNYFSHYEKMLPNQIEFVEIDFKANFENSVTKYHFKTY